MRRIYLKTSKGAKSLSENTIGLDERHILVLSFLDGTRSPSDLARMASLPESEVADILKKLQLVGYARSTPVSTPKESAPHVETYDGGPTTEEELGSPLGAPARPTRRQRREALREPPAASGAAPQEDPEEGWRRAAELEAQLLAERAERERLEREAAELELERQREREELAQRQAKEALDALERERAQAEEAQRRKEAEAAAKREAAELERARQRRLGIHRRRMRALIGASAVGFAAICAVVAKASLTIDPGSCAAAMARWSGAPAQARSCEARLFPTPSFLAKGLSIGSASTSDSARGSLSLAQALIGRLEPESLVLDGVKISPADASMLFAPRPGESSRLRLVQLENASIALGPQVLSGLSGSASLAPDGAVAAIELSDAQGALRLRARPAADGAVSASASLRWADPQSSPLPGMGEMSVSGVLSPGGLAIDEGSARLGAGFVRLQGQASWAPAWSADLNFSASSLDMGALAPWLFAGGRGEVSGRVQARGPDLASALASASLAARFSARDAALKLDLNGMLGASGSLGQAAFPQAQGTISASGARLSIDMPALASGPTRAAVRAAIDANGRASGSASASMPERGIVAQGAISGTSRALSLSR